MNKVYSRVQIVDILTKYKYIFLGVCCLELQRVQLLDQELVQYASGGVVSRSLGTFGVNFTEANQLYNVLLLCYCNK